MGRLSRPARGAASPARRDVPVGRGRVLAVLGSAALVGLLVGRVGAGAGSTPPEPGTGESAVAPSGAVSSSWFCAGATDQRGGPAPGEVVVANAGGRAVRAEVTILASTGASRRLQVQVPAAGKVTVAETVPRGSPWIGAIVDLDGGGAGVEQVVSGRLGSSAEPCATEGSATWYFANGATLVNATEELSLLNPYPTPATVDMSFTTDEGVEQPLADQAVLVPADSLVAVDLRRQLPRRSFIAATVRTNAGRVVVWKTDVVVPPPPHAPLLGTPAAAAPLADPASPYPGVTLALGAAAPSTSWAWPEGVTAPGVNDEYLVYNPGTTTASVTLAPHLEEGSAEPFTLSVGPGQVSSLDMASEARVPSGDAYDLTVRSTNGVPVVAERVVTDTSPSPREGIAESFGAPQPARSWLVGVAAVDRREDTLLQVADPGPSALEVSVTALEAGRRVVLDGLADVRIGAGGHVVIDLARVVERFDGSLVVAGSAPVVVGSDLFGRNGQRGVALSLGMPLAAG